MRLSFYHELRPDHILGLVLCILLLGCSTPISPVANLAVNTGFDRAREVEHLRDEIVAAGIPCGMRAMSLSASPITVSPADFDRAKRVATGIIIRDSLTVRVWLAPGSPELEVWEDGRKIREEPYKLYMESQILETWMRQHEDASDDSSAKPESGPDR